jgi:hypothetical protein
MIFFCYCLQIPNLHKSLVLLLLQQHVLAQLEAVADRCTTAGPPVKGIELELVLGPQDHVPIVRFRLQGLELRDIMPDHLERVQERDRLVLPRAACILEYKLGNADRAECLTRARGRCVHPVLDHEPLLVPGQQPCADLVRLEEGDLFLEPHLVAAQGKRDLAQRVQRQDRGPQERRHILDSSIVAVLSI